MISVTFRDMLQLAGVRKSHMTMYHSMGNEHAKKTFFLISEKFFLKQTKLQQSSASKHPKQ